MIQETRADEIRIRELKDVNKTVSEEKQRKIPTH